MNKKSIMIKVFSMILVIMFTLSIDLSTTIAGEEEITLSMDGYHQTENYTCGSASALMVLFYCGQKKLWKQME